ncbi:hypothetical protein M3610_12045 [Neobacillus sp. MER 74]|uniref:hypothetical protein n=1 Tax=Bacillaceae TaxID=186817 RepID=UPI000BF5F80D|nr:MULTISPECIES: hypothetical protein [Bacillaceae]MCM3116026.1 hypothetical protein [Neobacillus sp. MER 74]PFP24628.1 hypothetical protein COJ96_21525 [Bacillus sp. AFS073361]
MDKTAKENRQNVYREGCDGQNGQENRQNVYRKGVRWTKRAKRTGKMSIGRVPMDKTTQGNRQNVYREGSDGQNGPREPAKCLSEGVRWTKGAKGTGKMSIGRVPMDKTGQENRQIVYRKGSDGQNGRREPAKCLSEGVRWTKRAKRTGKMSIGRVPMDKTAQENRKNVYRKDSDRQNGPREPAKCLSEGVRWTKRAKRTGKMSIGRGAMDKTGQGNRQNVYREGSDGQNHTREPAKCLSEGVRWTKRAKGIGKMSIGRVPMDKTAQENRQNVYRKGCDGQNGPREQGLCLSGGIRWTKRDKGTGKTSIGRDPMDKTTQRTGKMSIGRVPMDKTAQENRQNVYRKDSDRQNGPREPEKCLSGGFPRTKPNKGTGKMSIGRVPMDKTTQGIRKNVYREGSDGQNGQGNRQNVYRKDADRQNGPRDQAKCLSGGFR